MNNSLLLSTHIEVGNGFTRVKSTGNHLHKLVGSDAVSGTSVKKGGEGRYEGSEKESNDVRPSW